MDSNSNNSGSNFQNTRAKGDEAENMAVDYLLKKGYEIKKRNFHFGQMGELDIIAEDKSVLVFIEVKSKRMDTQYDPFLNITPKKQRTIRKIAESYLYVNKITDRECRFDAISVDYTKSPPEIIHLVNAM